MVSRLYRVKRNPSTGDNNANLIKDAEIKIDEGDDAAQKYSSSEEI